MTAGNPPRNGEGDQPQAGGGGPTILSQPIKQVRRARKLRREMSLPEVLLWQALRCRPGGFKFRRQVPLAPYTVDFACLSARLVIEIDGEAHNRADVPRRDCVRDADLRDQGFVVLRVTARDVLADLSMWCPPSLPDARR